MHDADFVGGLEWARKAIELNPGARRNAQRNTNFTSLREDPEFLRIVME